MGDTERGSSRIGGTQLSVATWNLEWRRPGSSHARQMDDRMRAAMPEVVCLTEAHEHHFGDEGHTICASADHGYPIIEGRRKVLLWSRVAWRSVDLLGSPALPSGRFVSGVTDTSIGALTVIGVCVPWHGAHHRTGRRDRELWEDHLHYLEALGHVIERLDGPLLLLGDFNQRHPRTRQPVHVHDALRRNVLDKLDLATAGAVEPMGAQAIDHIAHTRDLLPVSVASLSNIGHGGDELSDHFGVHVRLSLSASISGGPTRPES